MRAAQGFVPAPELCSFSAWGAESAGAEQWLLLPSAAGICPKELSSAFKHLAAGRSRRPRSGSSDARALLPPCRYWKLDPSKVYCPGANAWDTAVHDASEEYKHRMVGPGSGVPAAAAPCPGALAAVLGPVALCWHRLQSQGAPRAGLLTGASSSVSAQPLL